MGTSSGPFVLLLQATYLSLSGRDEVDDFNMCVISKYSPLPTWRDQYVDISGSQDRIKFMSA